MGDVIHTLPSLTDATLAIKNIQFDWVIEESFSEIPHWHLSVDQVIPIALRRWRKQIFNPQTKKEWEQFKTLISQQKYDKIIDAQGLIKSAYLTRYAVGKVYGYSWTSAREPIASLFYSKRCTVSKNLHAVERIRQLFAHTLNYKLPTHAGDYGISKAYFTNVLTAVIEQQGISFDNNCPFLVFLHGTTRHDKHWPELYWKTLAKIATEAGFNVYLPWRTESEKLRILRILETADNKKTIMLPRLKLEQLAAFLAHATGVVAVDTGLGHMTAALSTPAVSLYGSTDPDLIGAYGDKQIHLTLSDCKSEQTINQYNISSIDPPHFAPMTPEYVWTNLHNAMNSTECIKQI